MMTVQFGRNGVFLNKVLMNEKQILDVPFTPEEVEAVVRHLRKRKSPGSDGFVAEDLQGGGGTVVRWLTCILNAVIELEAVPDALKSGMVVPVYKGLGKDPFAWTTSEVSL